jgi:hypothetical protein
MHPFQRIGLVAAGRRPIAASGRGHRPSGKVRAIDCHVHGLLRKLDPDRDAGAGAIGRRAGKQRCEEEMKRDTSTHDWDAHPAVLRWFLTGSIANAGFH